MPYTTLVAGTTITASWANANVRDQAVTPFASTAARASAITSPVAGMLTFQTDTGTFTVYNGSAWVCITPIGNGVATSQTTASSTYTDLATTGPAVTIETGAKAIITLRTWNANSVNNDGVLMSFAVSGATTLAANDGNSVGNYTGPGLFQHASGFVELVALTGGLNTFTAKYRADVGGTGTWHDRFIMVVGLP